MPGSVRTPRGCGIVVPLAVNTFRPWTPHYGEAPSSLEYPSQTLFQALVASGREYPDQTALHFLGTRLRYDRLVTQTRQIGRALAHLGVRAGECVACILPNTPHGVQLLYAANAIGAVVCFLSPDLSNSELEAYLTRLKPAWAVIMSERLSGCSAPAPMRRLNGIITAGYADFVPPRRLRRFFSVNGGCGPLPTREQSTGERTGEGGNGELPPVFSWSTLVTLASEDRAVPWEPEPGDPERPAVVIFTQGATAEPKPVVHSSANLNASARQTQIQGPLLPGHTVLSAIPFSLGFGLGIGLHTAVVSAAAAVLVPPNCATSLPELIRRHKPEYIATAPRVLSMVPGARRLRRTRLSFLMGVFTGGARLPAWMREEIEGALHQHGAVVNVREGYGLTETVSGCAVAPEHGAPSGSVGIPYPDMDIAVLPLHRTPAGPDSIPVADDEPGVIWVSGPTVMRGYLSDDGATPDDSVLVVDTEGRRWLNTGDYGTMDAQGFLYLLDRVERLTIEGDHLVSPGTIERVLEAIPGVAAASVIPGPVPTALVVPRATEDALDTLEETLSARLRGARLSDHPATIVFCRYLPHLPVGGIDYRTAALMYRYGSLSLLTA